ncbi:MAG: PRC-barrel domain-containing protein [Caldilineaceae bacterium]
MPGNRSHVVIVLSLLLTCALLLSACGNDEPEPVGVPDAAVVEEPAVEVEPTLEVAEVTEPEGVAEVEATEVITAELEATEVVTTAVEGAEESAVLTETAEAAAVGATAINTATMSGDVEIITDTQLVTGTEVLTQIQVLTNVVVLEQQLVTTVVTSTDLVTDVVTLTDQELLTETEFITATADVTPTVQRQGAVGRVDVVQLTATTTPSPTPSPTPSATPTVLVEVTEVVTATAEVTEVVTRTVTDTELVTDTVAIEVTPTPPRPTPTPTRTPTVLVEVTEVVTDTVQVTEVVTDTVTDTELVTETIVVNATPTPARTTAQATPRTTPRATIVATITTTTITTATSDVDALALIFVGVVDAENRVVRASDLLDNDVYNFTQENVGELNDLIVHLPDGRILFATLESGGFLGLGEETYPFPLSAFRYMPNEDALALNVAESQLTDAAGFDDDWPDLNNADYTTDLEQFWGGLGEEIIPTNIVTGVGSLTGTVARASNLIGSSIFNADGENLGDINDMLIDLGNGNVRYVVISIGEFLGLGGELHAIPMNAFTVDTTGAFDDTAAAALILNVDQSVLEQAPTFDPNAYPETTDTDWDAEWQQFWADNF